MPRAARNRRDDSNYGPPEDHYSPSGPLDSYRPSENSYRPPGDAYRPPFRNSYRPPADAYYRHSNSETRHYPATRAPYGTRDYHHSSSSIPPWRSPERQPRRPADSSQQQRFTDNRGQQFFDYSYSQQPFRDPAGQPFFNYSNDLAALQARQGVSPLRAPQPPPTPMSAHQRIAHDRMRDEGANAGPSESEALMPPSSKTGRVVRRKRKKDYKAQKRLEEQQEQEALEAVVASMKAVPPTPSSASKDKGRASKAGVTAPTPTEEYLSKAMQPSLRLDQPARLLIILDLNGTLLFRNKQKGKSISQVSKKPLARPGLDEFLTYAFANHGVMVWTSAQPKNAQSMVTSLFTPEQQEKLLGVWSRDTLGLTDAQYQGKVQVYKRLQRVWEGEFQIPYPLTDGTQLWDQTNTVLLDDSVEKAKSHPYNHIEVPEFMGTKKEVYKDRVLLNCIEYMEELKWQSNVSSYMREKPFRASAVTRTG